MQRKNTVKKSRLVIKVVVGKMPFVMLSTSGINWSLYKPSSSSIIGYSPNVKCFVSFLEAYNHVRL